MTGRRSVGFVVQRYGGGSVGGAERFTVDLASGLAASGCRVHVLTSCATSYEDWANVLSPGTETEDDVVVQRLPVTQARPNDRFIPLHLRNVDRSQPPLWPAGQRRWAAMMGPELLDGPTAVADLARRVDVVVFVGYHYAHSLTLMRHAAAIAPTVLIPTAHPEGAFYASPVRRMFAFADRVICLADAEAELVDRLYRCGGRTDVVGCPVEDLAGPSGERIAEARRRFGIGAGPYLVSVGRVDPAKGSDEAVHYTRMVRRSVLRDLQLVVIGPGDLAASPKGVIATGFVDEDDKLALVAGATALLQPSYMESFSLALMEGWLLGRPALVQGRNGVLAGHVRRSGGGVLYRNYPEFEAGAVALVGSEELRNRLGAGGREYVVSEFNWEKVSREFDRSLSSAVEAGRHRLRGVPHASVDPGEVA